MMSNGWKLNEAAELLRRTGYTVIAPACGGQGRNLSLSEVTELLRRAGYTVIAPAHEQGKKLFPVESLNARPWITGCHSDDDGECAWEGCPQLRDDEPKRSGRHCPLDSRGDNDE